MGDLARQGAAFVTLVLAMAGVFAWSVPATAADELGLVLSTRPSAEATDTVNLQVVPPSDAASRRVFVRNTGDEPLNDVTFDSSELVDANDGPVTGTVCISSEPDGSDCEGETRTIAAGSEESLYVHVTDLDRTGTFTSSLFARNADALQVLGKLTVTRSNEPDVLEIGEIQTRRTDKTWPWSTATVDLEVTVQNNGTRALTLSGIIRGLAIAGAGETGFQGVQVNPEIERVGDGSGEGGDAIEPGDDATFSVRLPALDRTGAYSATIKFSAPGAHPATQTFAFNVRESGWTAGLIIAASVLLSFFVRYLAGTGRTRLVRLRRGRTLLDDVRRLRAETKDAVARESDVLDALETRLVTLYDDIDLGTDAGVDAVLNEIDEKRVLFPLLVRADRVVQTAKPDAIREEFELQLDAVAAFLEQKTPADDLKDAIKTHKATLEGMPAAVKEKVKEHFTTQVAAFDEIVKGNDTIPAVARDVSPLIAQARTLAEADATFPQAIAAFEDARKRFAVAVAEDLLESVPDEQAPPAGFEPSEWASARGLHLDALRAVAGAKTADDAMSRYANAARGYLVAIASKLRDEASTQEASERDADKRKTLGEAISQAEAAVASAGRSSFREARDSYKAAAGKLRELKAAGMLMDREAPPQDTDPRVAELVGSPASAESAGKARRRNVGSYPPTRSLTQRLKRLEYRLFFIVALAAVVTGLQLLWSDNATWGGFPSWATAFLWGLGLHQVAGKALDLSALRTTVGGTGASDG